MHVQNQQRSSKDQGMSVGLMYEIEFTHRVQSRGLGVWIAGSEPLRCLLMLGAVFPQEVVPHRVHLRAFVWHWKVNKDCKLLNTGCECTLCASASSVLRHAKQVNLCTTPDKYV
eukprot:1139206-Pelagomonas_calceolata.AAC.1